VLPASVPALPLNCLILQLAGLTLAENRSSIRIPAMQPTIHPSHPAFTRRPGQLAAVLCSLALLLLQGMAWAQAGTGAQLERVQVSGAAALSEQVSLDQAVRMVRERSGGQVLRAETQRQNGRVVHRIRVLSDDGRVRNYSVDAQTGRIS
jgi:uncharacterized iron-regulated membrane protein